MKIAKRLLTFLSLAALTVSGAWPVYAITTPTTFKLKIYGWSNDEAYWAFGESGDYSGGAVGWTTLRDYVIDTSKNAFFKTFEKAITEEEFPEEGAAKKAAQKWESATSAKIKALGFDGKLGEEVYKKPVAVWGEYDSIVTQFGEKSASFLLGKDRYEIRLEDKVINNEDPTISPKSMFTLSLRKNGGDWKILQQDKTPFRNFMQYRIIYASVSPSRSKIAVLVEAIFNGYENSKLISYKGVTGAL